MSNELYPFHDKKGNNLTYIKWAAIVRNYLPVFIAKLPIESYIDVTQVTIQAERGLGRIQVSDNVSKYNSSNKIRTTTIHNVKGETLDSVMIVSSLDKKSKGGHWQDWFKLSPTTDEELEHKRYGYVGLSRPKHLLVIAVPKLSTSDHILFTGYGFTIEDLKTNSLF